MLFGIQVGILFRQLIAPSVSTFLLTWSLFSQHCVPLVRSGAVHTIGTLISLEREKEGRKATFQMKSINLVPPVLAQNSKYQLDLVFTVSLKIGSAFCQLATGEREKSLRIFFSFRFFNFLFTRLASFFAKCDFVISTFPLSLS